MDAKSLVVKSSPSVGGMKRKFDILDALNSHSLSNASNNNNNSTSGSDSSPTSGRHEKLHCSPSSGKMSNLGGLSSLGGGGAGRDAPPTHLNLSLGGGGDKSSPSRQQVGAGLGQLGGANFYAAAAAANSPQQAGQLIDSIEANKGYTFEEQFKQLYELSDDPKRKEFLDDLFQFMADRNQPVNRIPIMAKQVLDLYELYNLVVERGGLVEVINKKIWREITKGLSLPSSITSAAFTLRTQYMKYLYPYECAKRNFSRQEELQQAIDGNRREGRRSGATGLANFSYLAAANQVGAGSDLQQVGGNGGGSCSPAPSSQARAYSESPSPPANQMFAAHHQQLLGQHLTASQAAGQQHRAAVAAAAAAAAALQLHRHHQQQQQQNSNGSNHHAATATSRNDLAHQQRARSASSSSGPASPADYLHQQRLYQDSIESDRDDDDEASIDLGHSSKRNSPIDLDAAGQQQQLDPQLVRNSHRLHQQTAAAADQQQQQFAAAAAAALRQQLGAAINFAGTQNLFSQIAAAAAANPAAFGSAAQNGTTAAASQGADHLGVGGLAAGLHHHQQSLGCGGANSNNSSANATGHQQPATNNTNANATPNQQVAGGDLFKSSQEQFLAALMAAAATNQQQPQPQMQQPQHQTGAANSAPDQQAAARAALSMMATNAMLISAPNSPDALAIAQAAQAAGVKGAFVILLL